MQTFVPPIGRTPRPGGPEPEPQWGTVIGIVVAIILTIMGMLLPWMRHAPASSRPEPTSDQP